MNNKLNNTCIKCESVEHGKDIAKFYKENGWDNRQELFTKGLFYGVFGGSFYHYSTSLTAKVLTLEQAKDLVKENQYPKVMWVSDFDDFSDKEKLVVFAHKSNKFIAWASSQTFEEAETQIQTSFWKYAKDIESEEENPLKARIEKLEIELNELKKLI